MPTVSVVVPVYNRDRDLRCALASVQGQSYTDWECLVIDDASSIDIANIVADFADPRFRYIRREINGGPAAARRSAFAEVSGEYVMALDSDWELYPWALDQGARRLIENSTVDIVCALHLRHEDSRLFVRVDGRERVITPRQFRMYEPSPDRIAMVRRNIIDIWLGIPGEYFAFEAGLWITAELSRASLALDEPWVRYHTHAENRVTMSMRTKDGHARRLADYTTFLDGRRDLIDCGPCVSVDRALEGMYVELRQARHPDAPRAAAALLSRGINPRGAVARQLRTRVRRKLGRLPAIHWV